MSKLKYQNVKYDNLYEKTLGKIPIKNTPNCDFWNCKLCPLHSFQDDIQNIHLQALISTKLKHK